MIGQRQLQDQTRSILVLVFGASYNKDFTLDKPATNALASVLDIDTDK